MRLAESVDISDDKVKRAIDVVGSLLGLSVTAPLFLGTAAAVRISLGAPVFFKQARPGIHGKPFTLLKFRTMRQPRPGEDPIATDGVRLTPLGRLLRSWSLDELPTLLNVLRGDMSLVGPRPLLLQYLTRHTGDQARRYEVKPGITGWAQVHGRNRLTWEEKFAMDVWYVDHRGVWLDLKILAMTVSQVLRREGVSHGSEATMPEFMGTGVPTPGER
jgi:sugar transferase EpsL